MKSVLSVIFFSLGPCMSDRLGGYEKWGRSGLHVPFPDQSDLKN